MLLLMKMMIHKFIVKRLLLDLATCFIYMYIYEDPWHLKASQQEP